MIDPISIGTPAILQDIEQATHELRFGLSSDPLTGMFLRTLVASKANGEILELGTGTGMGTAWLLAGLGKQGHLTSVDKNRETIAVAQRFLGADSRVTFLIEDGAAFIRSSLEQGRTFDMIFADMHPGKAFLLDETLSLLKPGGIYIVDDLNPQSKWDEEQVARVAHFLKTIAQHTDLHITRLDWSTGLLLAVRI
jgi:predicted O-methyltransferase YrrM